MTSLNHEDWVKEQFKNEYLKSAYRNVFIHFSIIEGILVNESEMNNFSSANKCLLCSQRIDSSEFCAFDSIRKVRNKLAHNIFKEERLSQKDIDGLRDDLMKKIHHAYRISTFLKTKLFEKYEIYEEFELS